MHQVKEVDFECECQTRLWFSEAVQESVSEHRRKGDPNGAFWKKIKRYSQNGFGNYEGSKQPVKPEWDGVFRVGTVDSLFRIYGFYEDGTNKKEFIAIDAFLKGGQKPNAAERQRIDRVVEVKKNRQWVKVKDERYPRIAK